MGDSNTFEESAINHMPSVRPNLRQVKAIIAFMEEHPDFAKRKHKYNSNSKYKKLWADLSNIVNSMEGAVKSPQGWVKFWSDKKRFLITKQQQIDEGKIKGSLTALEQRILNLSDNKSNTPRRRRKAMKDERSDSEELALSVDNVFIKGEEYNGLDTTRLSSDAEDRQLTVIEKMVDVMDQQAAAMSQLAQASLANSKALASLAEASHLQAVAVDKLVGTFESIGSSALDIRNAILGIDYTLKRVYSTPHRQNNTLFS